MKNTPDLLEALEKAVSKQPGLYEALVASGVVVGTEFRLPKRETGTSITGGDILSFLWLTDIQYIMRYLDPRDLPLLMASNDAIITKLPKLRYDVNMGNDCLPKFLMVYLEAL